MNLPAARRPWYFLVLVVVGIMALDQPAQRWTGLTLALCTHALNAIAASILARRWCGPADQMPYSPTRLVLTFQVYFASTVLMLLVLSLSGILNGLAFFIATVLLHLAVRIAIRRPAPPPRALRTPTPALQRVLSASLLLVILLTAYRAFAAPRYEYDALTYHLYFPARWLQDGALSIFLTAFTDPAPAYAPSATEVYFLSLMLPLGDDTLARAGQFPYWLLLLAVVNALGRQLRLAPTVRLGVTLAVALIPAIAWQAGTAMVDIAFAAHFLCVVLFCVAPVSNRCFGIAPANNRCNTLGLLLSFSLLLSTKFLALAYVVALVPLLLLAAKLGGTGLGARPIRRRALLAVLTPTLFLGGFWYARNAVVTGNPLFPLEVRLGSTVVFPGAYGREAMANSPFNLHRHPFADAAASLAWDALHDHPFDANAPLARWAPFALIALFYALSLWERVRVRAALPEVVRFLTPVFILALFWYAVPFHQPRFLWPALLLALVLAASFTRRRVAPYQSRDRQGAVSSPREGTSRFRDHPSLTVGALFRTRSAVFLPVLAMVWTVSFRTELVETLRAPIWFMLVALAITILWWRGKTLSGRVLGLFVGRRVRRLTSAGVFAERLTAAAILLAVGAGLAASGDARDRAFAERPFHDEGWRVVDRHLHNVTLAYTGNNLPYFLLGRRFENRAIYVPARKPADGRYHTFVDLERHAGRAPPNTSEPPFDRFTMSPGDWLANLRAAGVSYVFVTNIPPLALVANRHDAEGFPIERHWLDALCSFPDATTSAPSAPPPKPFARVAVLAHGGVRLYQLDWSAAPAQWHLQPEVPQMETDALDQLRRVQFLPGAPIWHYPLARAVIETHRLQPLPVKQ